MPLTMIDIFAGCGGWSLGARWLGIETIQMIEIDSWLQGKLAKNFPNAKIHGDVKTYNAITPFDILTASNPCQPFSLAGKRMGTSDLRYLWDETLRIIQLSKPKLIVLEQVTGLLTDANGITFRNILSDLAQSGYEFECHLVSASDVGAIHQRKRIWVVAWESTNSQGCQWQQPWSADLQAGANIAFERKAAPIGLSRQLSQWRSSGATDGLSAGMARVTPIGWQELNSDYKEVAMRGDRTVDNRNAIKAFGNAILPQIAHCLIAYGLEKVGACNIDTTTESQVKIEQRATALK